MTRKNDDADEPARDDAVVDPGKGGNRRSAAGTRDSRGSAADLEPMRAGLGPIPESRQLRDRLQAEIFSAATRGLPIGPPPGTGQPAGAGGLSEAGLRAARSLNQQAAHAMADRAFAAMGRTATARAAAAMAGAKRMSRAETVAALLDAVEETRKQARINLGHMVEEELRAAHLLGAEMIMETGHGDSPGTVRFLSPLSPESVLAMVRASLAERHEDRTGADRPVWEGPNGGVLLRPELADQVTDAIVATALRGPQTLHLDASEHADPDESASGDVRLTSHFMALSQAFSPISHSVIHAGMSDLVTWEIWRSSAKMIYDVDGTTWEVAAQLDDENLVYTQMLHRLPHPNPVIVFPEPIDLELDESLEGIPATVIGPEGTDGRRLARMFACFVTGSTKNQAEDPEHDDIRHVHSSHPSDGSAPAALSLLFCGMICGLDGAPEFSVDPFTGQICPHHVCYRLSIDITDVPVRFADLAATAARTFKHLTISDEARAAMAEAGILDTDTSSSTVRETDQVMDLLVRRTLAFLIYLCCANPDIERVTAPAAKKNKKARKKAKARRAARHAPLKNLMRVGYRIGAQLRVIRREYDAAVQAHDAHTGPGRRPPRPHWRAAHTRRVRYGPGRAFVQSRWFWPTFVLGSRVRGLLDAPATIRKVTR